MKYLKGYNGTPEERFWKYVDKKGENECWEWVGVRTSKGYGQIGIDNKMIKSSRFSYELHYEKIPKGLLILHSCDNPPCVNPQHLRLGSQSDNMKEMFSKGRGVNNRGVNCGGHKLTWENVRKIRKLYITKKYTQKEIGIRFGVKKMAVCNIINFKTWKI